MFKLFLLTLAGTTARLKSTVTRLRQAPVTDAAPKTPPMLYVR